jgi:O-antigen ligase
MVEARLTLPLNAAEWTLERYIVISTTVTVFLNQTIAQTGFDIALGYPVILVNMLLLLIGGRLGFHPIHGAILAVITLLGFIATASSNTPANAIFSQVIGIAVVSTYYLSVLSRFPVSVISWMELYGKFAAAVSLYGVFTYLFLQHTGAGDYGRLTSIFSEPSFYIYTTLPALGYYLGCYLSDRSHKWKALLLLACYLLAQSSLGFIGLTLVLALQLRRYLKSWRILLLFPSIAGLLAALYFGVPAFRLRVNDTVLSIAASDVSTANASTLALLSNVYVAARTFWDHPLLGVGIGGYQYAYPVYIGDVMDRSSYFYGLNMHDAASLYLRIAAEMGIVGLVAFVMALVWLSRVKGAPFEQVRNAIVPYILVRAFRYGAYFSVELFFFLGLYILNYLNYRNTQSSQSSQGITT